MLTAEQKNQIVKYGDVIQRVGVEVIRAPDVDVEKRIKVLIANLAAEFASTYYCTILKCTLPATKTTRKFAKIPGSKTGHTGN